MSRTHEFDGTKQGAKLRTGSPRPVISRNAAGDQTFIVAPGAGRRLRLMGGLITGPGGANTIKVKFGGTQVLPTVQVSATGQFNITQVLEGSNGIPGGENEALVVNLSAATAVEFTPIVTEEDV
jgi:hypothetical protein